MQQRTDQTLQSKQSLRLQIIIVKSSQIGNHHHNMKFKKNQMMKAYFVNDITLKNIQERGLKKQDQYLDEIQELNKQPDLKSIPRNLQILFKFAWSQYPEHQNQSTFKNILNDNLHLTKGDLLTQLNTKIQDDEFRQDLEQQLNQLKIKIIQQNSNAKQKIRFLRINPNEPKHSRTTQLNNNIIIQLPLLDQSPRKILNYLINLILTIILYIIQLNCFLNFAVVQFQKKIEENGSEKAPIEQAFKRKKLGNEIFKTNDQIYEKIQNRLINQSINFKAATIRIKANNQDN